MKKILVVILFLSLFSILCACQSNLEPTVQPYTSSTVNSEFESEISPELTIIGQLIRMQTPPDCGTVLWGVVAEYSALTVISGTYNREKIYVVHGCSELSRGDYAEGSGDLGTFQLGDNHLLYLTTENVYNIGAIIPVGDEISADFDYYSEQVTLYDE